MGVELIFVSLLTTLHIFYSVCEYRSMFIFYDVGFFKEFFTLLFLIKMYNTIIEREKQWANKLTDAEIEKLVKQTVSLLKSLNRESITPMQVSMIGHKCKKAIEKIGKLIVYRPDGGKLEYILKDALKSQYGSIKNEARKWLNKHAKNKGLKSYEDILAPETPSEPELQEKEEKILCSTCGLSVPPDCVFCQHCGAEL